MTIYCINAPIFLTFSSISAFQDAGQPSLETSISGSFSRMIGIVPRQSSSGASAEFSTIAWKSQSGTSDATKSIASGTSDSETLSKFNTEELNP